MLWTNSSCPSATPYHFIFSGYEQELSDVLLIWKKPKVEGTLLRGSGFGEEKASEPSKEPGCFLLCAFLEREDSRNELLHQNRKSWEGNLLPAIQGVPNNIPTRQIYYLFLSIRIIPMNKTRKWGRNKLLAITTMQRTWTLTKKSLLYLQNWAYRSFDGLVLLARQQQQQHHCFLESILIVVAELSLMSNSISLYIKQFCVNK